MFNPFVFIGSKFKGILDVIGLIPGIISVVETIAKAIRTAKVESQTKHDMAVALVREAILAVEGFSGKDIMDEAAFAAGLDQVIHGAVAMLNASVWYVKKE